MTPLTLNRRTRTWYGARLEPNEPLRHPREERTVHLPGVQMAELPARIREAPVDRRQTALL